MRSVRSGCVPDAGVLSSAARRAAGVSAGPHSNQPSVPCAWSKAPPSSVTCRRCDDTTSAISCQSQPHCVCYKNGCTAPNVCMSHSLLMWSPSHSHSPPLLHSPENLPRTPPSSPGLTVALQWEPTSHNSHTEWQLRRAVIVSASVTAVAAILADRERCSISPHDMWHMAVQNYSERPTTNVERQLIVRACHAQAAQRRWTTKLWTYQEVWNAHNRHSPFRCNSISHRR